MKNTIEPHQQLEYALFKCFHIQFQEHKEIMEGDNQSLESDSKNKVGTAHRATLRFPELSKLL